MFIILGSIAAFILIMIIAVVIGMIIESLKNHDDNTL